MTIVLRNPYQQVGMLCAANTLFKTIGIFSGSLGSNHSPVEQYWNTLFLSTLNRDNRKYARRYRAF
jgi:hypothetical protein